MATQTVEFAAAPGQTVTAKLFTAGSDTVVQTASAVTEGTNRDGVYSGTFTDAAAGRYRLIATNANGTKLADWWVDIALATGTYPAYEMPVSAIQSGLSTLDAAGVRSAVGMASANLDTQLSDLPTVAEFEARTLLATAYFDPAVDAVTVGTNGDKTGYSLTAGTGLGNQTADITGSLSGSVGSISGVTFPTNFNALGINSSGHVSRVTLVDTTTTNTDMRGTDGAALAIEWTATRAGYLDSVVLAQNSNQRTVQITGSNHIAADIHEFQPDVLTSAATDATFVSEIAAAVELLLSSLNRQELSSVPLANASLADKITWLVMLARNRMTATSALQTLFADDTTTPVATFGVSDDGTTAERGEAS